MSEEKSKPEPAAEKSESEEQESQPTPTRQSRGGGWIFPAVIFLALGGWCVKDGWFTPGYEHGLFSKIMALVLIPVGVGLLVYEGLRPRGAPEEPVSPPDAESGPPKK